MLLTATRVVRGIFLEEVHGFLDDRDVILTPDFQQIGASGNVQTFEFQIPSHKDKKEKLIKTVNNLANVEPNQLTFRFIDVKETRQNAEFFVIANDLDKSIKKTLINSLYAYDIELIKWSEKEQWVDKLKIV